jgi:aspartate aminotransferase
MQLSERVLKLKPSPTLELTALANSLRAQGLNIIGFASGEPDFDTPSSIKKAAINAIDAGKTKYTPVGGIKELKEAIVCKFRRDNNLTYSTSEVTVNCGGKHSFYNLMQVLLNQGDEVIIPAPYWVSYPSMVQLAGGKDIIIDTDEQSGFKMTPEQLNAAITAKTKAIVINSPSNPTGSVYSKEELLALAEIVADKNICFISDDIYESILYTDTKFVNMAMLSDELKEKTIVLNGVSKTYSMTGWRIGYMAGQQEVIKKVETIQSQSTSNPSSISQWAALEAIRGDQSVIDQMIKAFIRRRTLIVDSLNSIPGVSCLLPDGAFYAFPNIVEITKLQGWDSLNKKYPEDSISSKISSFLLEEAQVAVVPGIAFGADHNVRLSFATSDDKIIEGAKRIKDAVTTLE